MDSGKAVGGERGLSADHWAGICRVSFPPQRFVKGETKGELHQG